MCLSHASPPERRLNRVIAARSSALHSRARVDASERRTETLLTTSRSISHGVAGDRRSCVLLLVATLLSAPTARAQVRQLPLTLDEARTTARLTSPELRAAREALQAAEARARQASAFPNPTLAYGHERTSRDDVRNSQHITALEQPLDVFGQRGARRSAGDALVSAARARIDLIRAQLDFAVARAFARALASERRAAIAAAMNDVFTEARRISSARLAAGDVSGYTDRRLGLEAARYVVLAAQAELARDSARLELASLLVDSAMGDASLSAHLITLDVRLLDSITSLPVPDGAPTDSGERADSLLQLAFVRRADLRVARFERDAAAAEIRVARSERLPIPVLSAGIKTERTAEGDGFRGFVAGISMPLPLWDRRSGAVAAAAAHTRMLDAQLVALRRQIAREVVATLAASRAVEEQLAALRPRVTEDMESAMGAVRVAYAEGEITLLEWLDAIRAYQEAQSTVAALQAESLIRRAALERAIGAPLPQE